MKGSLGVPTTLHDLYFGTPFYNGRMIKSIRSALAFNQSEVADLRLKIIEFQRQYGTAAAVAAYEVSRRSIFRWKKMLKSSQGTLDSLVPLSRCPKRKRVMVTHPKVVEYIRTLRERFGHLGKEKIKPLLDEYCRENHIPTIAASTIGKVIKRHGLYPRSKRIYHTAGRGYRDRHRSFALAIAVFS